MFKTALRSIELTGQDVDLETLWLIANGQPGSEYQVTLSASAREKMRASRDYIESRMGSGEAIYGVNTGFGAFSSVRISDSQIEDLQRNLIRSHSVGVGDLFSKNQARAILFLRANALARGHSGIRVEVVEKLLEFLNHDIIPAIPQQGSVGASGDLAPLSHLALAIIGEGKVFGADHRDFPLEHRRTHVISVAEALKAKGLKPLDLRAKEGLSIRDEVAALSSGPLQATGEDAENNQLAFCDQVLMRVSENMGLGEGRDCASREAALKAAAEAGEAKLGKVSVQGKTQGKTALKKQMTVGISKTSNRHPQDLKSLRLADDEVSSIVKPICGDLKSSKKLPKSSDSKQS